MDRVDAALIEIERACGSGSVLTDPDVLSAYAHDESEAPPAQPAAVIRARSTEDVAAVLAAANRHEVAVTPRSGGTGRVGGAVPVAGGLVLAFERMADVRGIDRDDMTAVVQPGVVTGELHRQVEEEGLFYAPDPNSLDSCEIGGNVATNAAGPRTFKYGVTREHVLGLRAVTADGTVLDLGRRTTKGVTGYDLTALMIGSEGTLGVVTEVTVKLLRKPEAVSTLLVYLPDNAAAATAVLTSLGCGVTPRCVELMDDIALDIVRPQAGLPIPAEAKAMLLMELDGDAERVDRDVETVGSALLDAGAVDVLVAKHGGERERLWAARRELSHSMRKQAKNKLAEDVVVPRSKIGALLAECRRISEQSRITMPTYGHAGDGNLHVNFLWDSPDDQPRVDAAVRALFESVVSFGGTLSGEHGLGILKAPYLGLEQKPELIALQERIKALFDPRGILNPGKIFPAQARRFHGPC